MSPRVTPSLTHIYITHHRALCNVVSNNNVTCCHIHNVDLYVNKMHLHIIYDDTSLDFVANAHLSPHFPTLLSNSDHTYVLQKADN